MSPRHNDPRSLTLTITSDTPQGFEEMLDLALKELKRFAKLDAEAGDLKHGETNGTVGSYSFDYLFGDPELRKLIEQVESEGYTKEGGNGHSYFFNHQDGRNLEISIDRLEIEHGEPIDWSKDPEPYSSMRGYHLKPGGIVGEPE